MNLSLLESFGQNYPEELEGMLDSVSLALTCEFNRRGTLLAVGCNDGRLVIWDFLTRGIAKVISAHVFQICSISWSRNGKQLLSTSADNLVAVWDVLSGVQVRSFRFPGVLEKAVFNPRNANQILVCPFGTPCLIIDLDKPDEEARKLVPLDEEEADATIVANYDRKGAHIYTGNSKGKVLVFKSDTLELVASFQVTSSTTIKAIEFAKRGQSFLVNSADRIIRVYETGEILACGKGGEPEPVQKLQDLVNKTQWKKCCFSGDGEYICAGSQRQHSLYIWEKSVGNLVKILHGTKGEVLLNVVWHPVRPVVCSVASGLTSVWAQSQLENWSAFTPDFRELDENVEYDEGEGEFDTYDEDTGYEAPPPGKQEEDEDVDVETVESISLFVSSDEEEEDTDALIFLPIPVDLDDVEENGGSEGEDQCSTGGRMKRADETPGSSKKPKVEGNETPSNASDMALKRNAEKNKKSAKSVKKKPTGKGPEDQQ